VLTWIQSLWTVLIAIWASLLVWKGHPSGVVFLLVAAANAHIAFHSHQGVKWAWWASWPLPIAALLLVGPMVTKNVYLYFTDHPLYLESPGTIITIAVSAVVYVIPAIAIMCLLIAKRRHLAPNNSLERTREG
jgi:hypothetical protein